MRALFKAFSLLAIAFASPLEAWAEGELRAVAETTNGGEARTEGLLVGDGFVDLYSKADGRGSRAHTRGEARAATGGMVEMRLTSISADGGDAFVDGYGEAGDGGYANIEAVSAARAATARTEARGSAWGPGAETYVIGRSHAVDGAFASAKSNGSAKGYQTRVPARATVHSRAEAWHGARTESTAVSTAESHDGQPAFASANAFGYRVGNSRRCAPKITAEAHSRGGRATSAALGYDE